MQEDAYIGKADNGTAVGAAVIAADQPHPPPGEPEGFIDTKELSRRLGCSTGTIQNWRRSGRLPYIKTPGRLVIFDWPSVKAAILRMQRGGAL